MRSKNYFKMPNDIFNKNLSAGELKVLAALYSLRSHSIYNGNKYIKVKQAVIARICGFSSTKTVSSALDKLCLYGYIKRIDRYYSDYHKLGTYVYTIPVVRKNYFFVDRRIFRYNLTSAQFRMYLFFCKAAASHSRRSWNSFNDIAEALGLKRSSVIKTVKELVATGLIKKYKVRKKDGSFSDNHYKVVVIKCRYKFRQKKKRHQFRFAPEFKVFSLNNYSRVSCTTSSLYFILRAKRRFVNRKSGKYLFFVCRGSPKFYTSYDSTHFVTFRRKNKTKLYLKYRCNLTIYVPKNKSVYNCACSV